MKITLLLFFAAVLSGQQKVKHEGADGLMLSSGKVELTTLPHGGAFVDFHLQGEKLNAMWDPSRMAREAGARPSFGTSKGHFLCVDGFGPVTKDEAAAGLSGHGEAVKLNWDVTSSSSSHVAFKVRLPLVQETLTRKITLAPGEQVALVESEIASELPFDRVMLWAEHATIGAPFLKLGKTIVDQSTVNCQTKPHTMKGPRTFPSAVNFEWPAVPVEGGVFNARVSPREHGSMNHIGCLMDLRRTIEYITAIDTESNTMLGYVFPRADYGWVQHWMNYPANGTYSWGLEFGMQPYDMTKRDILALSPMFGQPAFRWLPAKGKVATKFAMFLTKVPGELRHVDDVRVEAGRILIEDKQSGKTVTLGFAAGLGQQ
ncbi:MAG: hypothetical protein HY820_17615 [Acidobacteria bacterium]|nr:hypothetical protein [Acidobacteriota bacterium]